MKKLWILFTALALLAVAMPAVAVDVTSGAVFYWHGITDLSDADNGSAKMDKARIKLSGVVDEFNTISTELRYSNGADVPPDWNPGAVRVKVFKLATDITGALGLDLPVTIKSQAGVWESDFTGWWYATRAGYTFVGGNNDQQQGNGAGQLDIGVGPANLHYYHNFNNQAVMLGADAAFGPAGVWVAYKADPSAFGDGTLDVEGKYEGKFGDLGLSFYPAVSLNAGTGNFQWDAGLKVGFKMLTAAVSVNGNSHHDMLDKIEAEIGATAGAAAAWVALYTSLSHNTVDALQGVDIMGSYTLGAATVYLGYMIAADTILGDGPPVDGAEWNATHDGLYLGLKCSF